MKFPPEERARFLVQVSQYPESHITFPPEEYRRDDGRILITVDGLTVFLHRWAYSELIAPPRRFFLLRDCEERRCQNPHHWKPSKSSTVPRVMVTKRPPAGGMSAAEINGSKTHCPQNHEYTPANTYKWTDKKGHVHRKCKRCTIRRALRQRQEERGNNG